MTPWSISVNQLLIHKPVVMYADMKVGNGDYNTKSCIVCGRPFKPKNGNHNTCDAICSHKQKNASRRKRSAERKGMNPPGCEGCEELK